MTGFNVNHEELAATGDQTGDKAKDADGLQEKLNSADGLVPPKAWGLIGHLEIHHAYTEMFGTLQEHMSNMIQGVRKLGEDINNAADQYRQNDEAAEEKLKDIQKELGSA